MLGLNKKGKSKDKGLGLKENLELYLIILPVLIHIFIFSYIPLYGILIAFQEYTPGSAIVAFDGSIKWVGLKHFIDFTSSIYFTRLLKNTILLSVYGLIFGFWIPIAFALLLNELKNGKYKKFVQTASYLPHFISTVVVAGIVLSFITPEGLINQLLALFGVEPKAYNVSPGAFPTIYTITNIWKSFGWSSILYLSAISSIDVSLYEAARIDGANRFQQMKRITLPLIMPTVSIMLIFAIGGILGSNSELILLLYNPAVYETSDVFNTFVYRDGLLGGRFSYATAVGVFTSVINFALLYGANYVMRKKGGYSLW